MKCWEEGAAARNVTYVLQHNPDNTLEVFMCIYLYIYIYIYMYTDR